MKNNGRSDGCLLFLNDLIKKQKKIKHLNRNEPWASESKAGNIWNKAETGSSALDTESDDGFGDSKLEHLNLLGEDPNISSNPTLFPQIPADMASFKTLKGFKILPSK